MTETTILLLAASGAALALACIGVVRVVRAYADRRIETVLRRVDDDLSSVANVLREAVALSDEARADGKRDLILDLEQLLTDTVADAAARTGAEAVAMRVQGPNGAPMTAILGTESTVDWADDAAFATGTDEADERLAVPIFEGGTETGVIVAHARTGRRFLSGHRRALRALAEETAVAVESARRFAHAKRRVETDDVTGIRNHNGYEAALEREVTKAGRTRQPLSVVLLELDVSDTAESERVARELSTLLGLVSRTTDTVFRRNRAEFGVLLPETSSEGAQRFHGRLKAELERSTFSQSGELTLSTGISEWTPDETSEAFDARARATVGRELRQAPAAN